MMFWFHTFPGCGKAADYRKIAQDITAMKGSTIVQLGSCHPKSGEDNASKTGPNLQLFGALYEKLSKQRRMYWQIIEFQNREW